MEREHIILSSKEQTRLKVLAFLLSRELTAVDASKCLRLGIRQVRRLLA